ncbi:hypothetical protein KP509_05G081600 [Ceratopteris richardii]|uniref:Uncharacterized protein n=1 Tax=Ceratopteris richardii TaxID=49495 RepID=A0A8T2UQJ8_CERRI|nr:hypothetical protein KP509_05G081600 [Ceratopteris richardii]
MANVLRATPSLTFHPYRASTTRLPVSPRASFPRLSQRNSVCMLTVPVCETMRIISRTLSQAQELAQKIVAAFQQVSAPPTLDEQALISVLRSRLSIAGTVGCFAAISSGSVNTPLTVVASGMAKWLELYSGVLMLRVLLSWFPNIPWERQPLQAIRDMCDPYLNLFRNIIPPLFNALDVSPLLAFLVLGILTSTLNTAVQV